MFLNKKVDSIYILFIEILLEIKEFKLFEKSLVVNAGVKLILSCFKFLAHRSEISELLFKVTGFSLLYH